MPFYIFPLPLSKHQFHAYLLRHEALRFIKFHGGSITAPHVQGKIIASAIAGKVHCCLVKLLADVLSAKIFVHAKIVDIQSLNICQDRIIHVLLIYTEAISHHLVIFINTNKYRAAFVL